VIYGLIAEGGIRSSISLPSLLAASGARVDANENCDPLRQHPEYFGEWPSEVEMEREKIETGEMYRPAVTGLRLFSDESR